MRRLAGHVLEDLVITEGKKPLAGVNITLVPNSTIIRSLSGSTGNFSVVVPPGKMNTLVETFPGSALGASVQESMEL